VVAQVEDPAKEEGVRWNPSTVYCVRLFGARMGNSGVFQLRAMAHKECGAASGDATDLPKSFRFEWR